MTNQFKVLWVYQMVSAGKGCAAIKLESGQQPSLCFKGRKHMFCISAGHPVRVLKRDVRDFDKLREVLISDGPYPVSRAVAQFKGIAKRCGITAGAKAILDRAEQNLDAAGLEDSLINEEEATMSETNPETVPGETDSDSSTNGKETNVSKTKKAKKAAAPKAKKAAAPKKAKAPKAPKAAKGPSRISKAVEYMREEVKKAGGESKLERGFRKELFERAAKKFDLKAVTCSIQYNKQVKK